MPRIRDKSTGEVYDVDWNEDREPTFEEKQALILKAKATPPTPDRGILRTMTEPHPALQAETRRIGRETLGTDYGRPFANLPNMGPLASPETRGRIRGAFAGAGEGIGEFSPLDYAGFLSGGIAAVVNKFKGVGSTASRIAEGVSGATSAPDVVAGYRDIIDAQSEQDMIERIKKSGMGTLRVALSTLGTIGGITGARQNWNPHLYDGPIGPPEFIGPRMEGKLDDDLVDIDAFMDKKYGLGPESLLPEEIKLPELSKDIISPAGPRQSLEPVRKVPGLILSPEDAARMDFLDKQKIGPQAPVLGEKEPFIGRKNRLRDFKFSEAADAAVKSQGGIATPTGEFFERPRIASRLTLPSRGEAIREGGRFTGRFEQTPGKRVPVPQTEQLSAQRIPKTDRDAIETATKLAKELELELTRNTRTPRSSGNVQFDESGRPSIEGQDVTPPERLPGGPRKSEAGFVLNPFSGLGPADGRPLIDVVKNVEKAKKWIRARYGELTTNLTPFQIDQAVLRFIDDYPEQRQAGEAYTQLLSHVDNQRPTTPPETRPRLPGTAAPIPDIIEDARRIDASRRRNRDNFTDEQNELADRLLDLGYSSDDAIEAVSDTTGAIAKEKKIRAPTQRQVDLAKIKENKELKATGDFRVRQPAELRGRDKPNIPLRQMGEGFEYPVKEPLGDVGGYEARVTSWSKTDKSFEIELYDGDKSVARVGFQPTEDGEFAAVSGFSKVEAAFQGKGIGTKLYQEALRIAKQRGMKGIASDPNMRNLRSDALWNKIKTGKKGITFGADPRDIPEDDEYDVKLYSGLDPALFVKSTKKLAAWIAKNYKETTLEGVAQAKAVLKYVTEFPDEYTGERFTDRMLGTNKRAQGTNPRAEKTSPREVAKTATITQQPLPEDANARAKKLEEMVQEFGKVSPKRFAENGIFFVQGKSGEPEFIGTHVDPKHIKEGNSIIQVLSDGTARIHEEYGTRDAVERFARSDSGRAITATTRKRLSDLSELDRKIDRISTKDRPVVKLDPTKTIEENLPRSETITTKAKKVVTDALDDWWSGDSEEGAILNPFGKKPKKGGLEDIDALMEKKYGKDLPASITDITPQMATSITRPATLSEKTSDVINIARTIKSSFDLSIPLRQGLLAVSRHPILTAKNFMPMVKSFGSEKAFDAIAKEIGHRANFELYQKSGLALTTHPKHIKMGEGLTNREEAFLSTIPEKIPIFGGGIRGSNRAAVAFLNKTRADLFDQLVVKYTKLGFDPKVDENFYRGVAKYVNLVTGRGTLGKYGERIAMPLQAIFYSPRFQTSRGQAILQSLPGRHLLHKKWNEIRGRENKPDNVILPKQLQNELRKDLAATALEVGVILFGAAKWAGYKVSWDPVDPVGLKIKYKNTTVDLGAGFNQYLRYVSTMATGKGYVAGKKKDLRQKDAPFSHTGSATYNMTRSKLNPPAALLETIRTGRNYAGDKFDLKNKEHWKREGWDLVTPMLPRDMVDMFKDQGINPFSLSAAILSTLGASVSTRTKEQKAARERAQ